MMNPPDWESCSEEDLWRYVAVGEADEVGGADEADFVRLRQAEEHES